MLDSNAILMIFELRIPLEQELTKLLGKHTIIIPNTVFNELTLLSQQGDSLKAQNAKAALTYIKRFDTYTMTTYQNTDNSLILLAKQLNAYVVTNDKTLRKQLHNQKIPTIYLRGKHILQLEK